MLSSPRYLATVRRAMVMPLSPSIFTTSWSDKGRVGSSFLKISAIMLANACGGFLYLAIHAVLGEIFKHHKALVLGNFAAGFSLIAGLILYFHLRA